MARKSTIKTLPKAVLAEVNRLLADELWTLDQIIEHLAEAGHSRSRSALGRHAKNLTEVAEKLRRSREMAEALVKEIGPSSTEGKTGRLLVEILQGLVFDHMLDRVEGDVDDEGASPKELHLLARALKDLASAQKIDVDREAKIRERIAKQAADTAEEVAKSEGLSAATIAKFRSNILGVAQ